MVDTSLSPGAQPAPGWLAPGNRVYAIGDVHGLAGRLAELHAVIAADLAQHPIASPVLLHIGDYIDRGPDSAGVVRRLAAGPPVPGMTCINLRGNHEQMMLDALTGDRDAIADWRANHAADTLRSWGIKPKVRPQEWASALPPEDLAFLRALKLNWRLDNYFFVHAGVRPGLPLPSQTGEDMLWIREAFLTWAAGPMLPDLPTLAIVHGHTPEPVPSVTRHRIGIDTGAVRGGPLTCAVLEGTGVRFLRA